MEKYFIFRELLEFMANHTEVVDADMNTYCGGVSITGVDDNHIIKIEVSIKDKEDNEND